MSKLTLNQKIRLISRKAAAIHRREDGFSHIEDVLDAVNGLIYKYGLLFSGDLLAVEGPISALSAQPLPKGCSHVVSMVWTLEDVKTEKRRSWCIPGSGYDTDFDGTGVSKAITASRKTALILIFNLRVLEFSEEKEVEDRKAEAGRKQAAADKIAEEKEKAITEKRKKTNELKEKVLIEWPESHNGNYAWVRGRIHIYEKQAVEVMNLYAKDFNDRQDAWLVPKSNVRDMIADLELKGCTVDASAG